VFGWLKASRLTPHEIIVHVLSEQYFLVLPNRPYFAGTGEPNLGKKPRAWNLLDIYNQFGSPYRIVDYLLLTDLV